MPKTKKPTLKQQAFVREKLKGKSSLQAAKDAGYADSVAKNANTHILEKVGTQEVIASLKREMRRLGMDEKLVARRLNDSMFAEKLNNKGDSYTDWNAVHRAIDKFLTLNEISTEKTEVVHKGLEDILGSVVKPKNDT